MNAHRASIVMLFAAALLGAAAPRAEAAPLSVDVWTDRGHDGVYRPGEAIDVELRVSDDAYLLVYEIDAEGYVHVLFPYERGENFVEGRRTFQLADDRPDAQLVVQGPVGQGYIVAIASDEPFRALPWFLRPYDPTAEELGYADGPEPGRHGEDEGISAEGRVVGDPFVAMERIRRMVMDEPQDRRGFATSYTSYYVHTQVRYPRYLCNDCHRPGRWEWWDGFDPYYTSCSVFSFRVNYAWAWGPSYWYGHVPYFVYVYRDDCPPRYRRSHRGPWLSSWDGWTRWAGFWGGSLKRYKTPPPPGYRGPSKFDGEIRRGAQRELPPGFMVRAHGRGTAGDRTNGVGIGRMGRARGETGRLEETLRRDRGRFAPGEERGEASSGSGRRARPMPSGRAPAADDGYRAPERRERPSVRDEGDRGNGGGREERLRPSAPPPSPPPPPPPPREEPKLRPSAPESPRGGIRAPEPPPQRRVR